MTHIISIIKFLLIIFQNRRSNSFICKYLQQQAMGNPPVQDMHSGYTVIDSVDAILQLRNHTAAYVSILNEPGRLVKTQF